jgi:hypothetical protein
MLSCAVMASWTEASTVRTAAAREQRRPPVPGSPPPVAWAHQRCPGTCATKAKARGIRELEGSRRESEGSRRHSGKLSFFFKLTRIGCKISRSTTANISHSSLPATVTCEHACSTLYSTCSQLTSGDIKPGEPDRSSSATPV